LNDDVRPRPDPFSEIRILTLHNTRGANYWSRRPVTRLDVAIGAYEHISSAHVPGFTEQLVAALPGLEEHRCSVGTPGGFIQRLREGTYAAHIVEHVALALQNIIGHDAGFGQTRGTGELGEYTLVFEYVHETVGLRAAALALDVVQQAFAGTLDGVTYAVAELRALAETPAPASVRQQVLCGITGGSARKETRDALMTLDIGSLVAEGELIVDVSPAYLLHAGLPYSHSDIAIILDANVHDVPERFQQPERAARLVSIVTDAVPDHGIVVCPADAHALHDLVRDAGRRVVGFAPSTDVHEHAQRAARAAATALTGAPIGHDVA